jgi:hypothetical protein
MQLNIYVALNRYTIGIEYVRFEVTPRLPAQAGSSLVDFSSTLKMEAIRSSETLVYTISIRRHIPEDSIHHEYNRPKPFIP